MSVGTVSVSIHKFYDDSGRELDAYFEARDRMLFLQSRGGAKGAPNATNTEYGPALNLLLKRIKDTNLSLAGVWVDSRPVQSIQMNQRQILQPEEVDVPVKNLFTLLSNRMASVGRDPNSRSRGNRQKRLRFVFAESVSNEEIVAWLGHGESGHRSSSATEQKMASTEPVVLEDDETGYPEGRRMFQLHRRSERDGKLPKKAKERRLNTTGRLKCDVCSFDFRETYGQLGRGFIEAHHIIPVSESGDERISRLSDLALVCSNCHRMLHRGETLLSVEELAEMIKKQAMKKQVPES